MNAGFFICFKSHHSSIYIRVHHSFCPQQHLQMSIVFLTHINPIHPISTPYGFLMFSEGRESAHWKQLG